MGGVLFRLVVVVVVVVVMGVLLFELRAFDAILSKLREQFKRSQSVIRAYKIPEETVTICVSDCAGFKKWASKASSETHSQTASSGGLLIVERNRLSQPVSNRALPNAAQRTVFNCSAIELNRPTAAHMLRKLRCKRGNAMEWLFVAASRWRSFFSLNSFTGFHY
jgi:hypothetical protein